MRPQFFTLLLTAIFTLAVTPKGSSADEDPQELMQGRATYLKEIDFATRPIRDRYVSKLDLLKRTLGGRGDARGAAAVQDEIDAIKTSSVVAAEAPKIAGSWLVDYGTSGTRRITIKGDGTATLQELNGAPILPVRPGKLAVRGTDLLLEFEGDVVTERITATGNKLTIEQFNPKGSYPAGPAAARGTAVKASASKP